MTDRAPQQRHRGYRAWGSPADHPASLAPDQAQAAGDLVRVSRRSGRIGLAASMPEHVLGLPLFVGTMVPGLSLGAVIAAR